MASNQLSGSLDLLLLSVLERGEAHGYGVIARLRDLSDSAFDLPEGTVYPALHRLEANGLLSSRWDSSSGRRRRAYSITDPGLAALREKRRDWKAFSKGVQAVTGSLSRPARPAEAAR
jgi:PadR family transcriptional regulator PadR